MVRLSEIKTVAIQARPEKSSYGNCFQINKKIKKVLQDEFEGLEVTLEGGSVTANKKRENHIYLVIDERYIEDVDYGPVIVDGALDQFSEKRRNEEEDLDIALGTQEIFDESGVDVFTPDDELFHCFSEFA